MTNSQLDDLESELPELTIDPVNGTDTVNYEQGKYGVEFTGTAKNLPELTRVELLLNDKTWYSALVGDLSTWSLQIDELELADIPDGYYTCTVSATDENSNTATASREILLITHYNGGAPDVSANKITQADEFQIDGKAWYNVSGSLTARYPLTDYKLTDVNFGIGFTYDVEVADDGEWNSQVNVQSLPNKHSTNLFRFGASDPAKNWNEVDIEIDTDITTQPE